MILLNKDTNDIVIVSLDNIKQSIVSLTRMQVDKTIVKAENYKLTSIDCKSMYEDDGIDELSILNAVILEKYNDFEIAGNDWLSEQKNRRYLFPYQLVVRGKSRKTEFDMALDDAMDKILLAQDIDPNLLIIISNTYCVIYANSVDSNISEIIQPLIDSKQIIEQLKPE